MIFKQKSKAQVALCRLELGRCGVPAVSFYRDGFWAVNVTLYVGVLGPHFLYLQNWGTAAPGVFHR